MIELVNQYGDGMGWCIFKIIDCCGGQTEQTIKHTIQMNFRLTLRILIQLFFSLAQLYQANLLYIDQSINVWQGFSSSENYPRQDVGWDFQIILISWGVFEIYLIFIEGHYILNGDNDIDFRQTWNKIADIVQNLFLISSFIVSRVVSNNKTYWNLFCIVFFSVDTVLNFALFIMKSHKQEQLSIELRAHDKFFSFFAYGGQLVAVLVITNMYFLFDPFYNKMFTVFYWSIVFLAIFTTAGFILPKCSNTSCSFNGKNLVNLVYGLTFGIGSVYFAPVANIIFTLMLFRKCCRNCCNCSWIPDIEFEQ